MNMPMVPFSTVTLMDPEDGKTTKVKLRDTTGAMPEFKPFGAYIVDACRTRVFSFGFGFSKLIENWIESLSQGQQAARRMASFQAVAQDQ